jgi:hypothetical protein
MIYLLSIVGTLLRQYFYTASLMVCSMFFASAQTLPTPEYQVKAVFLFNFTQFVEWPNTAFTSNNAPLVIGVFGDNPFGSYLEETVKDEIVNGHPLIVQYYKNIEDIKTCHLLFINLHETNEQEEVVRSLKGRNILTVTNDSDLSKQEEIIKLYIKNKKIQFQINTGAAKEANLVVSSKLLNIAKIFISPKNN